MRSTPLSLLTALLLALSLGGPIRAEEGGLAEGLSEAMANMRQALGMVRDLKHLEGLAELGQEMEELGEIESMADMKKLGKLRELRRLGQLGEIRGLEELKALEQLGELGELEALAELEWVDRLGGDRDGHQEEDRPRGADASRGASQGDRGASSGGWGWFGR